MDDLKDRAIHYLEIALPRGILYKRYEMNPFPTVNQKDFLSFFVSGETFGISVRNAVNIVGFEVIQEMVELGSSPISNKTFNEFLRANTKGI